MASAVIEGRDRAKRSGELEDLETLLQRMGSVIDRRVLVFDRETLVGILSPADLVRIVTLRQAVAAPPGRSGVMRTNLCATESAMAAI